MFEMDVVTGVLRVDDAKDLVFCVHDVHDV